MPNNYGMIAALILIWALPALPVPVSADVQRVNPESFVYNERMQYVVSYLGIRIGTVEVLNRIGGDAEVDETLIRLRTFSGVPFLSVYTEFFSRRGEDGYFVTSTTFDRSRNQWAYYHASRIDGTSDILVDRGYMDRESGEIYDVEIDTLQPGFHVHDPLSFLSILRDSAHMHEPYMLDILIDREIEKINIDPSGSIDVISVRAFRNQTPAYHVDGVIEFEGIHGLSRKYQVWIGADERRIPLHARVRIGIGSVKIELEEYEYDR
jgi:hypothetical protein